MKDNTIAYKMNCLICHPIYKVMQEDSGFHVGDLDFCSCTAVSRELLEHIAKIVWS
jgi:hypothetical protein